MSGKALVVVTPQPGTPPPHVPTSRSRWLVAQLAGMGLAEEEIAYAAGIELADIKQWYGAEIKNGVALVTAKVGVALVRQARKGDVNAQRVWLQMRAKWVAPTKVEVTGKDGGPIEVEHRRRVMDSIVGLVRARQDKGLPAQAVPRETVAQGVEHSDGGKGHATTH